MQAVFNKLHQIWLFFASFFQYLLDVVKDVFVSAWLLLKDFFYWIFETVINLAVTAASALDTSAISGHLSAFGSIPAEVLNICGLLGMGTCMSIIAAAIVIRLVLQLIPFVRLGS